MGLEIIFWLVVVGFLASIQLSLAIKQGFQPVHSSTLETEYSTKNSVKLAIFSCPRTWNSFEKIRNKSVQKQKVYF